MNLDQRISEKKSIKTWLFVNKGNSKLDLVISKDAYHPDEKVHVKCRIDNSLCDKEISKVKISLKRDIECKTSRGQRFK